jgi:hypothetical protein
VPPRIFGSWDWPPKRAGHSQPPLWTSRRTKPVPVGRPRVLTARGRPLGRTRDASCHPVHWARPHPGLDDGEDLVHLGYKPGNVLLTLQPTDLAWAGVSSGRHPGRGRRAGSRPMGGRAGRGRSADPRVDDDVGRGVLGHPGVLVQAGSSRSGREFSIRPGVLVQAGSSRSSRASRGTTARTRTPRPVPDAAERRPPPERVPRRRRGRERESVSASSVTPASAAAPPGPVSHGRATVQSRRVQGRVCAGALDVPPFVEAVRALLDFGERGRQHRQRGRQRGAMGRPCGRAGRRRGPCRAPGCRRRLRLPPYPRLVW